MPTLSPSAVRHILEYIREQSKKGDGEATKLMPFLTKRAGIKKTLPELSRKAVKKAKRETRRERLASIREEVSNRAGPWCELCGFQLTCSHEGLAAELHHLESGSGVRRTLEDASNCMWVHSLCHRGYHADPEEYRDRVRAWAKRYGYPVPSRFRREPKA